MDSLVSDEYGVYNDLHGFKSGAELSNYLKEATSKYYGTAAEEFINRLLKWFMRKAEEEGLTPEKAVRSIFDDMRNNIYEKFNLIKDTDGQVQRVADVFALYATAGVLASEDCLGVLRVFI